MNNLEKYIMQYNALIRKILDEGSIDEYGDEEVQLSLYTKTDSIQVVEQTEDGIETFPEEFGLKILAEYLQDNKDFEYQGSTENNKVLERLNAIFARLVDRFNKGLLIPYLDDNNDPSQRTLIGQISYDGDEFILDKNTNQKKMSIYDAMPCAFDYMYYRRVIEYFKDNPDRTKIPKGYQGEIRYKLDKNKDILKDNDLCK